MKRSLIGLKAEFFLKLIIAVPGLSISYITFDTGAIKSKRSLSKFMQSLMPSC